jgi:hypothetical protein
MHINGNGSQLIDGEPAADVLLDGDFRADGDYHETGARGYFPGADDDALLTALAWDVDGFFCGAWGIERDERMDNSFRADPRAAYTVIADQRATNLFTS